MFNSCFTHTARPRCCAASAHSRQLAEHTRCNNAALSVLRVHCPEGDSVLGLDGVQQPLPIAASAASKDRAQGAPSVSLQLPCQQDARRSSGASACFSGRHHRTPVDPNHEITCTIRNCSSVAELRDVVDTYLHTLNHIHVAAALCKLPKLVEAREREGNRASSTAPSTLPTDHGSAAGGSLRQQRPQYPVPLPVEHHRPVEHHLLTGSPPDDSWWGSPAGHRSPAARSHRPSEASWPQHAAGRSGSSSSSSSIGVSEAAAGHLSACNCSTGPLGPAGVAASTCLTDAPSAAIPPVAVPASYSCSTTTPIVTHNLTTTLVHPDSTLESRTCTTVPSATLSSSSSSSATGFAGLGSDSSSTSSTSSSRGGDASTTTVAPFNNVPPAIPTQATATAIDTHPEPPPCPSHAAVHITHLLTTLLPLVLHHIPALGPRELCNCAWALAKLYPPPTATQSRTPHPTAPAALHAIIHHLLTHRKLWAANGIELSMLSWALATLRYRHPTIYPTLAHLAATRAPYLDPQALANISWALATANHLPEPTLLALATSTADMLPDQGPNFLPQHLANIAWAHARACRAVPGLHCSHTITRLLGAIASEARPRLREQQVRGLTSLAWAFAVVQPPGAPAFVGAVATALVARGGGNSDGGADSSSSSAGGSWAAGRHAASGAAAMLAPSALVLWACTRCGVRHRPLADAACAALLAAEEEQCGAKVLVCLAWALAVLGAGWGHPAFRRIVKLCASRRPAASSTASSEACPLLPDPSAVDAAAAAAAPAAGADDETGEGAAEGAAEGEAEGVGLPAWQEAPAAPRLAASRPPPQLPPRPDPERPPGCSQPPLHASQVAVVLWACVRTRCPAAAAPLLHPILAQATPHLRNCYPQELAQLAWACAALRLRDPAFLHALALAAARPRTLPHFKPRELANLLWCLRCLGCLPPQLAAAAAAHAVTRASLAFYKAEELAKLAAGLAVAPQVAGAALQLVAREARRDMGSQFSVASVANLLGALGQAGTYDGPLMDAAAERVVACQGQLRPWEAQRIADACVRLGYHHDQLAWVCEQALRDAADEL